MLAARLTPSRVYTRGPGHGWPRRHSGRRRPLTLAAGAGPGGPGLRSGIGDTLTNGTLSCVSRAPTRQQQQQQMVRPYPHPLRSALRLTSERGRGPEARGHGTGPEAQVLGEADARRATIPIHEFPVPRRIRTGGCLGSAELLISGSTNEARVNGTFAMERLRASSSAAPPTSTAHTKTAKRVRASIGGGSN